MVPAIRARFATMLGASLLLAGAAHAQTYLWQIGVTDTNDSEFALAPGGYTNYASEFPSDTTYIVGVSTPQTSWPYVQPGPADAWAGSSQHTFNVVFGLQSTPTGTNGQLDFALLDRDVAPSQLEIMINGQNFSITLPPGTGAATLDGTPSAGQEFKFSVPFAATALKAGVNEVQLTSLSGSWLIYDSVGMEAMTGAVLTNVAFSASVAMSAITPAGNLIQTNGVLAQPTQITLTKTGSAANGFIQIGSAPATPVFLNGVQAITALEPDVPVATNLLAIVTVGGQVVGLQQVTVQPVRHLTIYVQLHAHNDIGYTDIQANIIALHVNNVALGIQFANQTANYPVGSRFIWDPECSFSQDMYLNKNQGNPQAIASFMSAMTNGQMCMEGMYLDESSGLCRPEELINAYRTSSKLADLTGVPVLSAEETDVPGYTWGIVTAMAQAGIKYFSAAPNSVHRIGYILQDWQNKPFYWLGPDGQSKVLAWVPYEGYQPAKLYGGFTQSLVNGLISSLGANYPYNMTYIRYDFVSDNAVISSNICDTVRNWNTTNAYPKVVIAGAAQIFSALEQQYSNSIPVYSGDWTPYWEDGAGTSAHETAVNRNNSDRLTQAETLCALMSPTNYSPAAYYTAWTNILLYTEHTFGASDSVTDPTDPKNQTIWAGKQAYTINAASQSSNLLLQSENTILGTGAPANAVDIYNTLSWTRSELVIIPAALSTEGNLVLDDQSQPVVSQRLTTGDLAIMTTNIPPFAARRYTVNAGAAYAPATYAATSSAANGTLDNGIVHVQLNLTTGGITQLTDSSVTASNLVNTSNGENLNDYQYQLGTSMPTTPSLNGQVTITTGETGPLVSSLTVQSSAPGCNTLSRQVEIVAGEDYVQLNNFVDKTQVASGYYESVNFAFPFNIPGGNMLLDLPLAAMRPGIDQLAGSCLNWLTIGRWADITNSNYGVTWVTLDAPLIEVGSRTATLFGNVSDSLFATSISPGQEVYSWVMSNDWDTNFQPYQPGQTTFRYVLRPHRPYNPNGATRFAVPFSHPLIPVAATAPTPASTPLVQINSTDINVISLKPSEDGTGAFIVRLFGASGQSSTVNLTWANTPAKLWISNTDEKEVTQVSATGPVTVPGWGVVTLRAEMQ